jgi:hypothetical protein
MAFFASTDEFKTKEAHKEYAEYQLQDSRFVYEDPDNEDSPGAFLSEFILHIFTVQLNATQGRQIIDSLDFGLCTWISNGPCTDHCSCEFCTTFTKLANFHLQAKHARILARDDLIEILWTTGNTRSR